MSYLIDTCCVSELVKPKPDIRVLRWFLDHDEKDMYLSIITFGELRKGIEKLPSSKKKRELNHWVNKDLMHRFNNKVFNIQLPEIYEWGRILAQAEKKGNSLPAVDALIAATAIVRGFAVVTRNTKDMEASGVKIINPWEYSP